MTHDQERTIDLDKVLWERIQKSIGVAHEFMPEEAKAHYSLDYWVADICDWLETRHLQAAKREPVPQDAMAKDAEPLAITAEMVERVAIHLATKESANCKTLDAAVNHVNNWKRLIPEAYEILIATTTPRGG